MSVQSVNAADSTAATWWIDALKKKEQTQETTGLPEGYPPAANMDVSPMAQMLSKLDALAASDPEKFKTITAEIAAKLEDAAKSATGRDAEFLSHLAEQFTAASESGDVSALEPPQPRGRGYEHPEGEQTAPPPPPDGQGKGGPSETIRTLMDEIFASVSAL